MIKEQIEALREMNTDGLAIELTNACREDALHGEDTCICLAAYVLLRIQQDKAIRYNTLAEFTESSGDPESRNMLLAHTLYYSWDSVIALKDKYSEDLLQALILFFEAAGRARVPSTPTGVAKLAATIMEIQAGDSVADFCTGKGGFIRECVAMQPDAKYYGNDLNTAAVEIASIRAQILGVDICIAQEDVFNMKDKDRKFDVAFANYPIGMRARDAWNFGFNHHEEFMKQHPDFARTASLDWLFNRKIYDTISGPRRAVCIMTCGSTYNSLDYGARKSFLFGGLVEAVIALPPDLFQATPISTVMIVFSHGNLSAMMVDARDMCVSGRRRNTITDENIEEICAALKTEGEHSKRVSWEELKKNDFILNPARYLTELPSVPDAVAFEFLIKRVTRGTSLGAADLDELTSNKPTDVQYLMQTNIKDGIIDDDLTYLKEVPPRQERYCIRNNSLIISKMGVPFKIAVAEVPENKYLLASGNLFVIELDEEKANPYFVKAYLESDAGTAALNSITVGATVSTLGLDQLKRLPVPCPPLEKQKKLAEKYLALVDEVKLLRRKMAKATSNMRHLLDEDKEG